MSLLCNNGKKKEKIESPLIQESNYTNCPKKTGIIFVDIKNGIIVYK